jgi:predicted Zn-dependent protease with MMP-like domain
VLALSRAEFEGLVSEALDGVPPQLLAMADNVVVLVEDEPPEGMGPYLLGLYEGIPLTRRTTSYSGVLPDHIRIFQGPLQRYCHSAEQIVEQIRITVVHEIAHHFGISDSKLHALGYG